MGIRPEFSAPNHQSTVEQTATFQILQQTCNGFVGLGAMHPMVFIKAIMRIPALLLVAAATVQSE